MNVFSIALVALYFSQTSLSGSGEDAKEYVSVRTVVDKNTSGAETVRALFRNESGRTFTILARDVKYFAALAPSDPMFNANRLNEIPSRDVHDLGTPCLYTNLGHGDVTVTSSDGKTIVVDPAPRLTAEPALPTAPVETIPSGASKLVGPIQHFDDYHCGDKTAHIYRIYSVIQWTYQDSAAGASALQTTESPVTYVPIP
jgi:hypothetical protein